MRQRFLEAMDWVAARPLRVGLVLAGLVLLATWFIQLVLLGLIVPQWSDGHGLVPGQDVVGFNRVGMEQAALIRESGWGAWELRPSGWGVSGLLSAWYALTWPAPWAFAPVQALMYGLGGALVFSLVKHLTGRPRWALLAVVPMLLPTAAFLYAQPHRDLFVFFGLALAIYGWWLLARLVAEPLGRRWAYGLLGGAALVFAGYVVAWAVRAMTAEIFQGLAVLMSGLLLVLAVSALWRRRLAALPSLAAPGVAVGVLVAMMAFHSHAHWDGQLAKAEPEPDEPTEEVEPEPAWRPAAWLPSAADDRLRRLAGARDFFADGYGRGRTAVDVDRRYRSVEDMLLYTPRAMQIGLMSPFPYQWLPHEEAPSVRNVYRVAAGAEMAVLYAILPFLLYAIWVWRGRPELWVMLIPALSWVMVYAYTVPVVGALVRYRYGAYVIILAVAMAGLVRAVSDFRNRRGVNQGPTADGSKPS